MVCAALGKHTRHDALLQPRRRSEGEKVPLCALSSRWIFSCIQPTFVITIVCPVRGAQ